MTNVAQGESRSNIEAGVPSLAFRTSLGTDEDALQAVLSWNLERRHLSSSQKAAIGVEIGPLFDELEALAKQRQGEKRAVIVKPKSMSDRLPKKLGNRNKGHNQRSTAHKAAQALGTNRQYVSDAKKIKQEAPEALLIKLPRCPLQI